MEEGTENPYLKSERVDDVDDLHSLVIDAFIFAPFRGRVGSDVEVNSALNNPLPLYLPQDPVLDLGVGERVGEQLVPCIITTSHKQPFFFSATAEPHKSFNSSTRSPVQSRPT